MSIKSKFSLLLISAALLPAASSCVNVGGTTRVGDADAPSKTEYFPAQPHNKMVIKGFVDVHVEEKLGVGVNASDDVRDSILLDYFGDDADTLMVRPDFGYFPLGNKRIEIRVNGESDIEFSIDGKITAVSPLVAASSSSKSPGNLKVSVTGRATGDFAVAAQDLILTVTSVRPVRVTGKCRKLTVFAKPGTSVDLRDLTYETLDDRTDILARITYH